MASESGLQDHRIREGKEVGRGETYNNGFGDVIKDQNLSGRISVGQRSIRLRQVTAQTQRRSLIGLCSLRETRLSQECGTDSLGYLGQWKQSKNNKVRGEDHLSDLLRLAQVPDSKILEASGDS
jgi:hypothetical protein